jgi:hypothetical protein
MISIANVFLFMAGATTVSTIGLCQILISSLIESQPSTVMALKELLEERESKLSQLIYNQKALSDRRWSGKGNQEYSSNDEPSGEIAISMIRDISEAASIESFLAQGRTIVLNFVEFGTVEPEEFLNLIRQYHAPEKFKLTTVDTGIFVLTPISTRSDSANVDETSDASPKLLNEGSMAKVFVSEIPSAERQPEAQEEAI